MVNGEKISHGAAIISQIRRSVEVASWVPLVKAWTAKGVNLPLAGSFLIQCAQSAEFEFEDLASGDEGNVELSSGLFLRSCSPLAVDANFTLEGFCTTFC